jgi:DNA-binding MarR family transcriptional regulator
MGHAPAAQCFSPKYRPTIPDLEEPLSTGYFKAPNFIIDDYGGALSGPALWVWQYLRREAKGRPTVIAQIHTMCRRLHKSRATIKRAIRELEKQSLVTRQRRRGRANEYGF